MSFSKDGNISIYNLKPGELIAALEYNPSISNPSSFTVTVRTLSPLQDGNVLATSSALRNKGSFKIFNPMTCNMVYQSGDLDGGNRQNDFCVSIKI